MLPLDRMRFIIFALLVSCSGSGYSTYSASYAAPGVAVVATTYDGYPVYYADDYYWRYNNGYWYRSRVYDRGWVYAPPPRTLRQYAPYGYPSRGYYARRGGYYQRPVVRDDYRRPVVRDHRRPNYDYRRRRY